MMNALIEKVVYPLWDLKDGSQRLGECRRLLRSQWSSRAEVEELQLRRLQEMIRHAFSSCSFYQRLWGSPPTIQDLSDLRSLPIVRKRDIRDAGDSLLSNEFSRGQLVETKTGGSTGTSLKLYFDVHCQEYRNAAAMRSDRWAGWRAGMWTGGLWGTPPVPRTLKERIRNQLHDRLLFLDTMNLTPDTMRGFAQTMQERDVEALFGHAHSLFVFARFLEEQEIRPPQVKAIIATSMMLLASERAVIERVFRCPVSNRYGCEETGLIASQCEAHRGLHVNSEHLIVEILRADGSPASPGEEGEIVLTDLVNRGMPLVRYAIEDVATWASSECGCGRHSPVIDRLVGRTADFLRRRDGSLVAGVSLVEKTLTAIRGVSQLQIVQNSMTQFELNVVPDSEFSQATIDALCGVIRDVFGADIQVTTNTLGALPQERNSKYRFAICRLQA